MLNPPAISQRSDYALRGLIAFAAARSYSVSTNNPLNAILPLFEPIAGALHGRQFVASDLSRELLERYDLIVSEELCTHWAGQLVGQKLLKPIASAQGSGGYEWSQGRIPNSADGAFADELIVMLHAMRSFAEQSGDLITGSYSDEQLVGLLRKGAIASMFPQLHAGNNPTHRNEDEYIFSRFVAYANLNEPKIIDSLAKLRRAVIYSDLILHLREPKKPAANAQNIYAYLDSPLVMDLVGLGGKLRKAFAERLVRTLREIKIVGIVSPVMVDEIKGNIAALVGREPRDRFGPTADALRRGEFRIDFVQGCADRVETLIEDAGLQIDRNFGSYLKAQYTAAGKSLEEELLSKLQSHYRIFGAAERDAESLFGCFGRRAGLIPTSLYSSRCFFITSNDMLAAVGNRFFRDQENYTEKTFPIVVTRAAMAAIADAIGGVATQGGMSEQELIVSAADATAYDPLVFDRIEKILREMTPDQADDLSAILQRTDIAQLAMDLVRGNPSNVTSQRVSEIADSVKNRLETEAEVRVADSIERERAAAKATALSLNTELSERESRISSLAATAHRQHRAAVAAVTVLVASNERGLVEVRHSKAFGYVAAILVGVTVGFSVYLLSFMAEHLSWWIKLGLAVVAALGAGIPLAGLPSVRQRISSWFERRGAHRLAKAAVQLGYTLPADKLVPSSELRAALDEQFATFSRSPEKLTPPRDLFSTDGNSEGSTHGKA